MELGILHYRENFLDIVPRGRLRALAAEGLLQGVEVFFLEPATFDPIKETISAFYWSEESQLKNRQITIPQLVILHGSINSERYRYLEKWMFANRLVIADKGMSKIRQKDVFSRSVLAPHVIPTETLNQDQIIEHIMEYTSIFSGAVLKMATSNQGTGIIFITQEKERWRLLSGRHNIIGTLDHIAEKASKLISKRMEYRDYVIQPFIKSCVKDGRGFDIRAHIQKDGQGQFICTRLYARLAEVGSLLPNTSKGGYQTELSNFLDAHSKEKAQLLKSQLIDLALLVGQVHDQHSEQPVSELGVDFILDEQDKIYLVETNALPQSKYHELERAENVIGYAKFRYKTFLTKQTIKTS